ncbi:SDR family NAD(P)-dependent oxidoreductase [Thalassospira sp. UBA1131]|uniref:SDR family NAD(P)-dependent oxidoreductase n=1 Tax=Thalassospira sp. UBA1131 TaxID=1947672 RepID=UPI0025D7F83C|nr:SDR family NAD(P)-dependent oxidoreductase [Thalassospira sp. UBA1131]
MSETKTILISGANRGIGNEVARTFAKAGWNVSMGMRKPTMPDWAGTVDPAKLQVFAYDATDSEAPKEWVKAAREQFGGIDAVVANAGIMVRKSAVDVTDAEFDSLIDVNVNGPRRLVQACWNSLLEKGRGRVVIVSSLSGKRVKSAISGAYSVSKYAALGLSHAFRHAGFEQGVRTTALCPGFVATDMGTPLAGGNPDGLTTAGDVAESIFHVINLPNSASVSELWMNCSLDDSY